LDLGIDNHGSVDIECVEIPVLRYDCNKNANMLMDVSAKEIGCCRMGCHVGQGKFNETGMQLIIDYDSTGTERR
jgi:hypothetical protein